MAITICRSTPILLSLEKLRQIKLAELTAKALRYGVENMTEDEARRSGFSNEEIHRLKATLLVTTAYDRRTTRRRGEVWVPPILLRGDYDEAFNVKPTRPVEFIELLDILPIGTPALEER